MHLFIHSIIIFLVVYYYKLGDKKNLNTYIKEHKYKKVIVYEYVKLTLQEAYIKQEGRIISSHADILLDESAYYTCLGTDLMMYDV